MCLVINQLMCICLGVCIVSIYLFEPMWNNIDSMFVFVLANMCMLTNMLVFAQRERERERDRVRETIAARRFVTRGTRRGLSGSYPRNLFPELFQHSSAPAR